MSATVPASGVCKKLRREASLRASETSPTSQLSPWTRFSFGGAATQFLELDQQKVAGEGAAVSAAAPEVGHRFSGGREEQREREERPGYYGHRPGDRHVEGGAAT